MRRYIEYKNEISDTDLYDGLVGYGLFAEKIPNFLTSVEFLAFTKTLNFPINEKPKILSDIQVCGILIFQDQWQFLNHLHTQIKQIV